jgi:hypothetical protein
MKVTKAECVDFITKESKSAQLIARMLEDGFEDDCSNVLQSALKSYCFCCLDSRYYATQFLEIAKLEIERPSNETL